MKRILILILAFSFTFCTTSKKAEESNEQTSPNKLDADSTALEKFISLTEEVKSKIPNEIIELVTDDQYLREKEFYTMTSRQKLDNENYLVAINTSLGCTPVYCQIKIFLLEFNKDKIVRQGSLQLDNWQTEENTRTSLLHNTFFIAETISQYADSEPDPDEQPVEYPVETETKCLAVFNDKIAPLDEFTKPELLLLRNLIFARYGHQFKLDSLREYFSQFDWYKPVSSNVSEKLTGDDKKIVQMILEAEKKPPMKSNAN